MCIIVFDNRRDSNERLSKEIMTRCLNRNKDGMGIMYPAKGILNIWKTMDDFEGIWGRYCSARERGLPVAVHFRKNTKGHNSVENCHPFVSHTIQGTNNTMAFMHNGTIYGMGDIPKELSDTRYFNEAILSRMSGDFLSSDAMYGMVKKFINGDRMLFMDNQGHYTLFNEKTGVWEFTDKASDRDGVWFSHTRDREYFMTGKEPVKKQQYMYGHGYYTGAEWYSGASTQKARQHDRVVDPLDRGKCVIKPKYLKNSDQLVFVYGTLRDDIKGDPYISKYDATFVGLAQANLKLCSIKDGSNYGRPGAFHTEDESTTTYGFLLHLKSSFKSRLIAIDRMMGIKDGQPPYYYRTKVKVKTKHQGTDLITEAYAWLATPIQDMNSVMCEVENGDWGEWEDTIDEILKEDSEPITNESRLLTDGSKEKAESTDSDTIWYYSVHTEDGRLKCLVCDSINGTDTTITVFTGAADLIYENVDDGQTTQMYYCDYCQNNYPTEMTDDEIEDEAKTLINAFQFNSSK